MPALHLPAERPHPRTVAAGHRTIAAHVAAVAAPPTTRHVAQEVERLSSLFRIEVDLPAPSPQ